MRQLGTNIHIRGDVPFGVHDVHDAPFGVHARILFSPSWKRLHVDGEGSFGSPALAEPWS
jgi:hypothetical protein